MPDYKFLENENMYDNPKAEISEAERISRRTFIAPSDFSFRDDANIGRPVNLIHDEEGTEKCL